MYGFVRGVPGNLNPYRNPHPYSRQLSLYPVS